MSDVRSQLRSQRLRLVNHQGDALRLGMNWTEEDLAKPQVLVDSAYGQGHPGTFHYRELIEEVSNGIFEAGGKPGVFTVSDICDGVVQATSGMSYSLVSRDIMAAMVEIHALGHPHDGMVLISGNDKSVPAHLLAIARCDLPAIHLPGGTQLNAPNYTTSDQMWSMGAEVERGELSRQDLEVAQRGACPTCGACQFMGSASTGQVMSEALGLALPGSALTPAPLTKLLRYARATGKQILPLIDQGLTPRRILNRDSFENAIILHAAIGGSTNALLHLPVMAREAGVDVGIDDFDRIHRRVPVLANAARDADAMIAQYATVGAAAIAALTRCRVIARYGSGVDIVDVDAATRRGILVTNVPSDWCENEVADHAMALLLALARKICVYDRATRSGTWQWQTGYPIHRLRGRQLGLLSFGAISRAIAQRASAFGMRVAAHDPYLPAADIEARGAASVSFEALLEDSDYLVVQAPLTKETHHLIGEGELRRMKPTAIVVNTARGPIVSDEALYSALTEGWIAGAGLDDIEEEPAKVRDWKPVNPLFGLPNVVITPHAAYYSEESITTVRDFAAHEVVRVLTGAKPLSPVNARQLAGLTGPITPGG